MEICGLNNEENKAIEKIDYIIDFIIENGQYNADVDDIEYLSEVLCIIEKQSKEIEEYKKQLDLDYVDKNFIRIDKIKAKIEEIDEVLKGQLIEKIRVYFEAQKEVLQSLLEKE